MNEQLPLSPKTQSTEVIVEVLAYKRPKKRPSSCGCNKRTRPSVSSNIIKSKQVHTYQNPKKIEQVQNVLNPHSSNSKQVNSTLLEPAPKEKSVLFTEKNLVSHTNQQEPQRNIENHSTLNKVKRYFDKFSFFRWLMKRND
ncbi:hypothetical protein [Rossellomorea aquimaris]|uniref:hypothetical protein n=1 Tax=Rossellomorea aquimaris TaxID=189382 RepID=UPI0005CA7FAF|nr:hypothetical protein [Rossellomorea aquimaris]